MTSFIKKHINFKILLIVLLFVFILPHHNYADTNTGTVATLSIVGVLIIVTALVISSNQQNKTQETTADYQVQNVVAYDQKWIKFLDSCIAEKNYDYFLEVLGVPTKEKEGDSILIVEWDKRTKTTYSNTQGETRDPSRLIPENEGLGTDFLKGYLNASPIISNEASISKEIPEGLYLILRFDKVTRMLASYNYRYDR